MGGETGMVDGEGSAGEQRYAAFRMRMLEMIICSRTGSSKVGVILD